MVISELRNCPYCAGGSDVGDDFGTNLPGRDDKVRELTSFVLAHLEAGTCGSAYVSGPPGTGKTATLKSITSHPKVSSGYRIVYINCTGMRCSSAVYAEIAKRLGVRPAGSTRSEKSYLAAIENYLASSHKMILLVLDEMDQLESRNQSVLYTVFSWTTGDSGLVLIGVANALDLTDRLLPRIATRGGVQPLLVHFPPYTRNQIIDIVRTVLGDSKKGVTFGRGAVELLASKVSSVSGDARRAIDITRRTIDVALVDKHMGYAYATSQTLVSSGLLDAADSQGSASGGADSCFPLQQKLLVCSLLLIRHNSPKSKEVTVGMLHQVYQRVCERRNLSAVDLSEFVSLVELVEARGVMKIVGKTKNRLAKVGV
ncbi:hypothetical protein AAG570_001998 [Ranatra chinensis]|uniref:AAA+ ATPase domain-containing protein n=1 Tax=Ranatra chinensis TaxID=642074 RepID=A0ABD0YSQ5_9HEMI